MVGAQVAASGDAARETVALFASTPDGAIPAGAAIRYRVRSTAPGRHYLFDLAPTRSYRLRADAVPGSPGMVAVTVAPDGPGVLAASTDAGMLAFDLVGGQIRVAP
jgi:hypothetical protein